jgi:hypothetical protein
MGTRKTKEEVTKELQLELKKLRRDYYRISKELAQKIGIKNKLGWSKIRSKQYNQEYGKKSKIIQQLNAVKRKLKQRGVTL